ncbi:hypothetical protein [Streptomyces mexicanus]|uniref:hypothetical protein n=1 Tax=Streptomyces mexicanus TaxID=178566 RepID=UPI0036C29BC8
MEQRTGTSSQPLKTEPVTGAGFDPAFIPGLTPPVTGEPEDAATKDPKAESPQAEAEAGTGNAAEAGKPDAREQPTAAAEAGETAEADGGTEAEDESADGPVFEAADRRARIVADHKGVRLSLDDQECEFRWDEIGAVETTVPRFGKRYTVTVHTPERRWYPIEIEAASKARIKEWETQLDAVLDAYFEDGAADAAHETPDADETPRADKTPDAGGKDL